MRPSRRGRTSRRPRSSRSWCETADWLSAEHRGQVAHAQLAVRQRVEDADAGRIAEGAEGVGQALDRVGRTSSARSDSGPAEVDLDQVADFVIFEHMSNCSYVTTGPESGTGVKEPGASGDP